MASAPSLNRLNEQLRGSPLYRQWFEQQGIDLSRPIGLSDQQRKQFAAYLRANGVQIPKGVEIDKAGNLNEPEGFGKQAKKWGPIVGAGAAAAFGIPGLFPGLLTGGGAGAAGAAGAGQAAIGGAGGTLASYGPSAALQSANMAMGPIGGTLAAGGNLAAGAAGGLLGSYGPSQAMQTAGATLPSASQVTPTAALGLAGALPNVLQQALQGGDKSAIQSVLENLMKWGPAGLAGLGAIKGLSQGPTPAEDEMAKLLRLSGQRAEASGPLFDALNRMTLAQLPRYAREGQQ